ncbi:MAG: peptidase [Betaproteobacteria bacterium]|nr:proteasome-type protease [Rhodocyclaceae bacterium]MCA3134354.1 proteasome-type protease [Rhodocyclaceae bacterium]MCA3141183.1 proteasome-type protease [Rhodocyclaceae bacterium]MCA3145082.1 proteasome-type protease [Rhodocyclaceae bacterium]MCE2896459.1 proteasome-type protease [Betaproteobacteria bacterium]
MTYCVAIMLDSGMLFASDSRTNAGVDHIAIFSKMKVFEKKDDRVMVLLSSGNLAITQGVTNILDRHGHLDPQRESIWTAGSLYDVATMVGESLREMQRRDGPFLAQGNVDFSASLLLGGQIAGEPMRLFNIYAQGNFIEATPDTRYFQIGESKYGKPVLDRVVSGATPVAEAAKCVLISFDSTIRSNISVGLPIEMLWYPRDALRVGAYKRITEGDPYFGMLRQGWGGGLRRVFGELPNPDWLA